MTMEYIAIVVVVVFIPPGGTKPKGHYLLLALHYMRCDLYPFSSGKAVAAAKTPLAHTLYILFLLRLRFLVNQQPTPFLSYGVNRDAWACFLLLAC